MNKNYLHIEKPDCVLLSEQEWPDLYISNTGVLIAHEGSEEHEYRAGDFENYVDGILRGFVAYKDYDNSGHDEVSWECERRNSDCMKQAFFLAFRKGILQFKDGRITFSRLHFDHIHKQQSTIVFTDKWA